MSDLNEQKTLLLKLFEQIEDQLLIIIQRNYSDY